MMVLVAAEFLAVVGGDARYHFRVVLLEDGETVHNAFFDRRFREKDDAS